MKLRKGRNSMGRIGRKTDRIRKRQMHKKLRIDTLVNGECEERENRYERV